MDEYCIPGKDHLKSQVILNGANSLHELDIGSEEFARTLDRSDPLRDARKEFYYPTNGNLSRGRILQLV